MKNNLLAIGIDKYRNNKISQLNNCVNDITNTIDVLTSKYEFHHDDVKVLLNEEATQDSIIYSLEDFVARQNSGENLIILFSGHGDFDKILDLGYFVPHDAELYKKNSYIPNSTILNYIKAFDYRHTVIISDSCFSGSIFSTQRKTHDSKEKLFEIPSKWALTSGRLEPVDDGVAGANSPFASSLITSLQSSDDNIGILELTNKIIREVADSNAQIPRGAPLQLYGDKGGEFFFKIRPKKIAVKKPMVKIDTELPTSLQEAISEYFIQEEKLEASENVNNIATSRRIAEEITYIKRAIDRNMISYFELKRSDTDLWEKFNQILGKDIRKDVEKITKVKINKQVAVKIQDYLEARRLKDEEESLQIKLTEIFEDKKGDFIDLIGNDEEDIIKDYAVVSLINEIFSSNLSFESIEALEMIFKNIFFAKLSKDIGKITKYRFQEEFDIYSKTIKNMFEKKSSDKIIYGNLIRSFPGEVTPARKLRRRK